MPTFAQNYEVGDVIYGASQARGPYMNSLPQNVRDLAYSLGAFLICDEYNNRTFGKRPVGMNQGALQDMNLSLPNSKQAIKTNVSHHDACPILTTNQKTACQHYYKALSGSDRAPLKSVKVKPSALAGKGNSSMEDLVFRRACKFGIEYIIMTMGKTVHFALDMPAFYGMPGNVQDSMDVVMKTQHGGHVPITTSELRCCYRNWMTWGATGRLKFYANLQECNPPWVTHPEIWAIYKRHRIEKGAVKI